MLFLYDVQEAADKNGGAEEQKKNKKKNMTSRGRAVIHCTDDISGKGRISWR